MDKRFCKLSFNMVDEVDNRKKSIHFCYVERALLEEFMRARGYENRAKVVNDVAEWVQHDFNIELSLSEKKDMLILRELIVDKYKRLHPNLFLRDVKNVGSWMRVWISEHMSRELKRGIKNGKH